MLLHDHLGIRYVHVTSIKFRTAGRPRANAMSVSMAIRNPNELDTIGDSSSISIKLAKQPRNDFDFFASLLHDPEDSNLSVAPLCFATAKSSFNAETVCVPFASNFASFAQGFNNFKTLMPNY